MTYQDEIRKLKEEIEELKEIVSELRKEVSLIDGEISFIGAEVGLKADTRDVRDAIIKLGEKTNVDARLLL
jgi:predicted RNase H-like nuclease (RuvC/YqgF family)